MRADGMIILQQAGQALVVVSEWVMTSLVLGLIGTWVWEFFFYGAITLLFTAPLSGIWHFAARHRTGKRRVFKEYLLFLALFHALLLVSGIFFEDDFLVWVWETTWSISVLYAIMAVQSVLVDWLLNLCEDYRNV